MSTSVFIDSARQDQGEEFRLVPGFPGYRVSNLGRVQSCREKGGRGCLTGVWRDLRLLKTNHGHLMARFYQKSRLTRLYVHRLVLGLFGPPCPDGMECCHNNDDPTDNRLSNLRWDTHKNNILEASRKGRMAWGNTNGKPKLSMEQVREIRRLLDEGNLLQRQIAQQFGICQQAVSDIARGRRHIS